MISILASTSKFAEHNSTKTLCNFSQVAGEAVSDSLALLFPEIQRKTTVRDAYKLLGVLSWRRRTFLAAEIPDLFTEGNDTTSTHFGGGKFYKRNRTETFDSSRTETSAV